MTSLVVQSRPSSSLVVQSTTGGSLIVNTPGIPGPPAPALQVQYSIDGSSWSTSYISNAMYIRLSIDGGATYPVGPLRLMGNPGISAYQLAVDNGFEGDEAAWLESMKVKGDPAPQVRIEYSPDGDEWHSVASDGDNYLRISVDDGDTWGSPLLVRGIKGDKGDPAPLVSTEYSLDGVSWSSAYTDGDVYLRLSVDGGITWGSSLTIRGSKGDPGDKGDKGDPGQDGAGIPSISEGDSRKVLAVKSDESGAEWVNAPSGGGGGVSLGLVIALS